MTLAQVFSCEFGEISKNTFCYRTPPVAASEQTQCIYFSEHIQNSFPDNTSIAVMYITYSTHEFDLLHVWLFVMCFLLKGRESKWSKLAAS